MWVIKAALVFLVIWAVWCVSWVVLFAAWDIGHGRAPLPITIGAIVALLIAGKIMQRKKPKH